MVVENLVVGEVAFRFLVWGNNPGTDLEVGCQNRGQRIASAYLPGTPSQPKPTRHV
jgi:hypothetical protein